MKQYERPDKSGNSCPIMGSINLTAYPIEAIPHETRFPDAAFLQRTDAADCYDCERQRTIDHNYCSICGKQLKPSELIPEKWRRSAEAKSRE